MPTSPDQSRDVVTDSPQAERYELWVDGALAGFASYRTRGEDTLLTHVEVFDEFGGRGLGRYLVTEVVADLNRQHRQVVPVCPFAVSVMERL